MRNVDNFTLWAKTIAAVVLVVYVGLKALGINLF